MQINIYVPNYTLGCQFMESLFKIIILLNCTQIFNFFLIKHSICFFLVQGMYKSETEP